MVIGERVGRYTQQKGQPRSGLCQAVRGGRGRHQCLSNPVHGNAGQAPPPVSRRHTGVGRRGALAQCSSAARQRVPKCADSSLDRGSRYGQTDMPIRISRRRGKYGARPHSAWRVLLGRGEGRRRGGAGRRLCCSWSAGWSVSCGTVRGLVGRVAAVLPASLVVSCSPLPFPCGNPLSAVCCYVMHNMPEGGRAK